MLLLQLTRAVSVLDEMHAANVVGDITLYNAFLIAAAKTENPHIVINIFKRYGPPYINLTTLD